MIRKAQIGDVKHIQALINHFARQDIMLPRSLNEIYDNIRDFWVFDDKRKVAGCCALHVCWQDLTEIKSLAVDKARQGLGIGKKLVDACIAEAGEIGAKKVFVLTYQPRFFKKFGFKKISTASLPHKVWAECINCPKFPHCQETAMVRKI